MTPGDRTDNQVPSDGLPRCRWARGPWLTPYHDREWGVAVHDDHRHFELLVLESAQAGLSWLTVLKRRGAYHAAFCDFDPHVVAGFTKRRIESLLADPGIIRNRAKIESTVTNADVFLAIEDEFETFDDYVWAFVGGSPIVNRWTGEQPIPASTELSGALSADLRRRGMRFVGPTTCYSYLQSAGLVLDHVTSCFRFAELTDGIH